VRTASSTAAFTRGFGAGASDRVVRMRPRNASIWTRVASGNASRRRRAAAWAASAKGIGPAVTAATRSAVASAADRVSATRSELRSMA
jgi:hypothetical protein